jgi:hypothetical protein
MRVNYENSNLLKKIVSKIRDRNAYEFFGFNYFDLIEKFRFRVLVFIDSGSGFEYCIFFFKKNRSGSGEFRILRTNEKN